MKKIIMAVVLISLTFLLTGCKTKEFTIEEFESMLTENNVTFERNQDNSPDEGINSLYYYYFDDESVLQLFVFDTKSDLYKSVKKNGYLDYTTTDYRIYLTLNENMGITFDGNSNYKSLITTRFEEMKK